MKVEFTKSFEKSIKALPKEIKEKTKRKIDILIDSIQVGTQPKGLGLKKLRHNLWEIRVDIKIRVIFQIAPGKLRLIFAGSHDQLKRFLRSV